MTESHPTNFHHFYERKMLSQGETISDYKEVSKAEKLALETSDAAWSRPSQDLIDWWNDAFGDYGSYNESTGYFEAYASMFDISVEEARLIRIVSNTCPSDSASKMYQSGNFDSIYQFSMRTVAPIRIQNSAGSLQKAFKMQKNIEAIGWFGNAIDFTESFVGCSSLHTIASIITPNTIEKAFSGCISLKEVRIRGLKTNLSLSECGVISYASVEYLINNAANTTVISLTVHPDVYAKLIGDTTSSAYTNLSSNEKNNWTMIRNIAAQKNIIIAK